jgi:predicted phage baseplate assembly protein
VVDELGAPVTCAVARGNLVLAHDARPRSGTLPPVPGEPHRRFRPVLTTEPLAFAEDPPASGPAAGVLRQDPARCLPLVTLDRGGERWESRGDLLASDRFDRGFVVEVERDGRALLRFGDDVAGRRPPPSTVFDATWWAGGGAAGNVGRDVLNAVVTDLLGVVAVNNPLPAEGGTDPETVEHVRQHAPAAFVAQERAVTTADWVEVAERRPEVAHAAARLRWTGSWWTVFLTLDLAGGRRLADEPELAVSLRDGLDRFRIAGYDLELRDPVDVAVELRLHVCVAGGHFVSRVRDELVDVLSARTLADGRRGLFHPDNFTFGDPVTVSRILAAAAGVPGVASASVTELHPIGAVPTTELSAGLLTVGDLEIIRLDNDPSRPERGVLHLDLDGGL